jgi:hypothetical protein
MHAGGLDINHKRVELKQLAKSRVLPKNNAFTRRWQILFQKVLPANVKVYLNYND